MAWPSYDRPFGRASITSCLPRQADVFGVRRHASKVAEVDFSAGSPLDAEQLEGRRSGGSLAIFANPSLRAASD